MEREVYWELFYDTGDPVAWLLHRATDRDAGAAAEGKTEKVQAGHTLPRPGD